MEMSIHMAINRKPWFFLTVFYQLIEYVEFKADFHYVSMRVRKDLDQKWYDLPYLATDNGIAVVLNHWPIEWRTASNLTVGSNKYTVK